MSRPDVSVCVTTRNQRTYIRQCLESVLAQSVDVDIEILVGDDCSDDGTSDIVAEFAAAYPSMLRHIRHSPRLGGSANTQALLACAHGRFIARLDGDDYWMPGKLRRQVDFLNEHPGCAAVYTNALTVSENGQPIGLFNDVGDARFDLAALLRRGNFLNNSSLLTRADRVPPWLAIRSPLIDFRAHLLHARAGYLAQIGEPLTAYRVNAEGSMVTGANDQVRHLYWEAIMDVPRNLVTDLDFAMGLADFLRRVTFRAIRMRRPRLLREWAPRVFAASPYGATRTGCMVVGAILRSVFVATKGRLLRGPDGRRMKVLYRR